MSDDSEDKAEKEESPKETTSADPLKAAVARTDLLKDEIRAIESELKILNGRIQNRNPKLIELLKKENADLEKRLKNLKAALYALIIDTGKIRRAADGGFRLEALRKTAIKFCVDTGVDEDIWKSIEY